jgi:hypothetical protein
MEYLNEKKLSFPIPKKHTIKAFVLSLLLRSFLERKNSFDGVFNAVFTY